MMLKNSKPKVKTYYQKRPKIYAYIHPDVPSLNGHIKVGETTGDVDKRIKGQTQTSGVIPKKLFEKYAQKSNGTWFSDHDLHRFFELNNIKRSKETTKTDGTEWFDFTGRMDDCEKLTDQFIRIDYDLVQSSDDKSDYILRSEQQAAVNVTKQYYDCKKEPKEFLWNAKPRFGKTLTTYGFIRQIKAINVLILSNRPTISDQWLQDFKKFIEWKNEGYSFVSSAIDNAVKYEEFAGYKNSYPERIIKLIFFASLQDLKGAIDLGGKYDKLSWMKEVDWDLIVIDESHEGVDTSKSQFALNLLKTKFTLYLSGTPYKAIASEKFRDDQIFNWSYYDEQKAKNDWDENNGPNPYAKLPKLHLFTYKMSEIIKSIVSKGIKTDSGAQFDYAFTLNDFFKVNKKTHKFEHEADVKKFLDVITQGQYPFSLSENFASELNHTFWLLPRVAAVKALAKLLKNHDFFKDYHVILAVGNNDDSWQENEQASEAIFKKSEKSLDKVKKVIQRYEKTITLSVCQLTTGVTVPEWTGVFMLRNINSPSFYFQAAFRVQNPHEIAKEQAIYWKENAYIFDFAPDRTLSLYDQFANGLTLIDYQNSEHENLLSAEKNENIKKMLNFFPVIAQDTDGSLRELNLEEVLIIPNQARAEDIVKSKFLSNFLFAHMKIFRQTNRFQTIIEKLQSTKKQKNSQTSSLVNDTNVDTIIISESNVFGNPILGERKTTEEILHECNSGFNSKTLANELYLNYEPELNAVIKKLGNLSKNEVKKVKNEFKEKIISELKVLEDACQTDISKYNDLKDKELKYLLTESEQNELDELKKQIHERYTQILDFEIPDAFEKSINDLHNAREKQDKRQKEDKLRNHLRSFTRTIPIYLMIFGDEKITLNNYETYADDATFEKISGISKDDFLILKNGDKDEHGETRGVFHATNVNASFQHFLNLKKELANYFDSKATDDIFNYIPNQKTNQIFTPKAVVKEMVDQLAANNPDLFTNKNHKFLDIYCKSGLYLGEIIKRLNVGLEKVIPDAQERIRWIFKNQIYGICPSDILLKLASNYLCADRKDLHSNLQVCQAYEDLKNLNDANKLALAIANLWKDLEMKFDVIIGNPPYQEEDGGPYASARPLYQYFMSAAFSFPNVKYVSLITPSRWMTGGKGLNNFRAEMLENKNLIYIYDYCDSKRIFPDNDIMGGGKLFFI